MFFLFLNGEGHQGDLVEGMGGQWLVGGVDPGRALGFQPRPESALLVGNGEKAFFLWESDSSFVV